VVRQGSERAEGGAPGPEFVTVVFTKSTPPYVAGDIATFAKADLEQYSGRYRLYVPGMKMPRNPVRITMVGDKSFRSTVL